MLTTTSRAPAARAGRAIQIPIEGGAVDTSWVLMLVFAVGGFAGILLTALMVMAGGGSEREEPRDQSD